MHRLYILKEIRNCGVDGAGFVKPSDGVTIRTKSKQGEEAMSEIIKWNELTPEERNVLIAQKVMGLRVEHWTEETYKDADPNYCYVTGYVIINEPRTFSYWSSVPRYTQSLDSAMQVVQAIKPTRRGYLDMTYWSEDYSTVVFHLPDTDEDYYDLKMFSYDGSLSLPEAICIAALKAKGYQVDTSQRKTP